MMPDRIPEMVMYKAKWDPKQQMFIWRAYTAAQACERKTGIPASVTLAQAVIESAAGEHHGGNANNYFGIKAPLVRGKRSLGPIATGYKELMTTEVINGVTKKMPDDFRTYRNMADSIEDHGGWIQANARYKKALANYPRTGDADQFAKDLALAQYATAINYAVSVIAVMKKYDLYKYNLKRLVPRAR